MLLKSIFIYLNIILFVQCNSLFAQESAGLPQFDTSKYSQQIFWLIISFTVLYVIIKYYAIKNLKKIKINRNNLIRANIEKSIKIKNNIEKLNNEIAVIKQEHKEKVNRSKKSLLEKISDLRKTKQDSLTKYKINKLKELEENLALYDKKINIEKDTTDIANEIIKKFNLK